MCLDRLSVKISSAGQGSIDNYLDRYKYDLQAVKQLNKEIKELSKKYCYNCGVELTEDNTALPNMCNECKYGEE